MGNNQSQVESQELHKDEQLDVYSPNGKYIYVLELEGDKMRYVGATNDVERRWMQHRAGNGSEWTKKHKPIRVLYYKEATSQFSEDDELKIIISKLSDKSRGGVLSIDDAIGKVRGGSYSQITLTNEQISNLKREITHSENRCFVCSQQGHLARFCPNRKKQPKLTLDAEPKKKVTKKQPKQQVIPGQCQRCKRFGHEAKTCNTNTNKDGAFLCMGTTSTKVRCKKKVKIERGLCHIHK